MKNVIGFHYSMGGNKNGIGDLITKLNQNGIPIILKGTDDAGLIFEGMQKGQQYGVENHLIYRLSTSGQNNGNQYDTPDYTKSPKSAAQEHFNKTAVKWPQELNELIVWSEPINEPRAKLSEGDIQYQNMHPVDWLGFFMLEYAKIANAQGFKVCGPSFNSGEPEVFGTNDYELPGMLAYLDYCATNPTKVALSIHEYSWARWLQGENWNDWYPSLWGRVEAAIAAADKHNIPRTFSIFATEWGFAYQDAPRWPECEPYLTDYNKWAAKWPQVKGVAAWNLASGWGNVDQDLQSWFLPLGNYAVNTNFPVGQQPQPTHELFGSTLPGEIIMTLNEKLWKASLDEYNINKFKPGAIGYPGALGIWKRQLINTKTVPAHNEIAVTVDGISYSIQGFIDPFTQKLKEVGVWTQGKSIWTITDPGVSVPLDPF